MKRCHLRTRDEKGDRVRARRASVRYNCTAPVQSNVTHEADEVARVQECRSARLQGCKAARLQA